MFAKILAQTFSNGIAARLVVTTSPILFNTSCRSYSNSANDKAIVHCEFEENTCTAQYVVSCPTTKECAIIDPVLDFNLTTATATTKSANSLLRYIDENKLSVNYIMETHIHADHVTASNYLQNELKLMSAEHKALSVISKNVTKVQKVFAKYYNCDFHKDNFNVLVGEGDVLGIGRQQFEVLETFGHTPACLSYLLPDDAIFVGDTFFMPDSGTARCDFPKGCATTLWNSLQRVLQLNENTRMFLCHDYKANGTREQFKYETTIKEQKENNIHLKDKTEEEFINWRKQRDDTLSMPRLFHPSLQYNLRNGAIPIAESNGTSYLKFPTKLSADKSAHF